MNPNYTFSNRIRNTIIQFCIVCILIVSLGACASDLTDSKLDSGNGAIVLADDSSQLAVLGANTQTSSIAPHFCQYAEEITKVLLTEKNKDGNFKIRKKDGSPYNLYEDELKIYSTLNVPMQRIAENAIRKHLSTDLQKAFTKNNKESSNFPFASTYNGERITTKSIAETLQKRKEDSERYKQLKSTGITKREIERNFEIPTRMKLFSWGGEIDTVLSPNDSIRYCLNLIQTSFLTMEPSTGEVKAWVGSINSKHFPEDLVRKRSYQMNDMIRPFVYASAFSMEVITPCTAFTADDYCIEPCEKGGKIWCPQGTINGNVKSNFTLSNGRITPVMARMGACAGPQTIAGLLEKVNIHAPSELVSPSIGMGTPTTSLFDLVAAYGIFANNGYFQSPLVIRRIEDKNGKEIYSSKPSKKRVLSNTVAFDVLQLMEECVDHGSATSLQWSDKWGGISKPVAAFTGNSSGNSNGWFIGIKPDLITGIWCGSQEKTVRFRSRTWGQGARMALPVYGYFMQNFSKIDSGVATKEHFSVPKGYDLQRFDCND